MKKYFFSVFILLYLLTTGCQKREITLDHEIKEFVWTGMHTYYLWEDKVPNLDEPASEDDLYDYLKEYDSPKTLFEDLKYKPEVIDRWSWIVDDYIALEQYFSGVRKSSGAKIKLYLTNSNSNNIYGVVRYIVPGTDAASKPISRGAVFSSINGVVLNKSNYESLLYNSDSYTLNLGTYFYNTATETVEITATGEDVTLNKGVYTENPIFNTSIFNTNGNKVGYLMYNSFTSNFDQELNDAFLQFKNENITDLILDLRYNGGGSVRTAIYLSSMISGLSANNVFTKEQWNNKLQTWHEDNHPEWLINYFATNMHDGTTLNRLNLSRVIVLTTGSSASASELVINALKPYIDVITIGTTTHGKYVASVTLYDADDWSKKNANTDHTWAIQPIVLKELNSIGEYAQDGFSPTFLFKEDFNNMGEIGTDTEPLTARALQYISGMRAETTSVQDKRTPIKQSLDNLENEMYVERRIALEHF